MDLHAHVRGCTHRKCNKHYTSLCFFYPLTWQWDGAVKFTFYNDSWVLYVFVFTSLVMAKKKKNNNNNNKKNVNETKIKKIKNGKHTKIHNIVLHLADGQYIFLSFVGLFVTSVWHDYPFCWCVEVRLWAPGSGPAPLLSATFNSIKHSAITEVNIPQSLGPFTF